MSRFLDGRRQVDLSRALLHLGGGTISTSSKLIDIFMKIITIIIILIYK